MKVAKFNVQVYLNAGLLEQNSLIEHADFWLAPGYPGANQKSNWEKGRQLPTDDGRQVRSKEV